MRKRINLSVDTDLYAEVSERATALGMRSPCALARAALRVVLDMIGRREEGERTPCRYPDDDPDDAVYLREMFTTFGDWQLDREHKARQGLGERM